MGDGAGADTAVTHARLAEDRGRSVHESRGV